MSRNQGFVAPLVTSEDEFFKRITSVGITIVDVYSKWAGPVDAILGSIKQLKTEFGDQFNYFQAESLSIPALKCYQGKSMPTFLVFFSGILVNVIRGVNVPLIEKTVKDEFELEGRGLEHVEFKDGENNIRKANANADFSTGENAFNDSNGAPVETTLAVVKPDGMNSKTLRLVFDALIQHRFNILSVRKVWLNADQARKLYSTLEHQAWFDKLVRYISSGPILGIYMARENAIQTWRDLMGPGSAQRARSDKPSSIRALCGIDSVRNAVHGSDCKEGVVKERAVLFAEDVLEMPLPTLVKSVLDGDTTALVPDDDSKLIERTICVVKPNIVAKGQAAVDEVLEVAEFHGFEVIRRDDIHISKETAADLLKDSQFVLDTELVQEIVDDLSSQTSIAVLLKGLQALSHWIEVLGPEDPEDARKTYPQSIRARLGTSKIQNVAISPRTTDEAQNWSHLLLPRTSSASRMLN